MMRCWRGHAALVAVAAAVAVGAAVAQTSGAQGDKGGNGKRGKDAHENPVQRDPGLELLRLRNEGVAHFESGIGLKKARDRFAAALRLKPGSAIELYNLGTTHRKLGDLDQALKLLGRAAQADASLPHPLYSMALIYRNKGDNARTLEMLAKARPLAPNEPSVYYQLGRMQREGGKNQDALQAYLHALQLDPYHTGALYQLYLYYQEQGDKDLAQRTFEEFSRIKRALSASRKEINEDESVLARPIGGGGTGPYGHASSRFEPVFAAERLIPDDGIAAFDVYDIDRDGSEDLVLATRAGRLRVIKYRAGAGYAHAADWEMDEIGIGQVRAVFAESFARGEAPRLVVLGETGVYLTAPLDAKGTTLTKLSARHAKAWAIVDVDHDGDLDVVLDAFAAVLVNQGNAAFVEEARYLDAGTTDALRAFDGSMMVASDLTNQAGVDFVLSDATGQRRLLKDALGGTYTALPPERLALRPGLRWSGAADLDNDGRMDVATLTDRELVVDFNIGGYRFETAVVASFGSSMADTSSVAIGDFNNDGRNDVIVGGGRAPVLWINQGSRKFVARAIADSDATAPKGLRVVDLDGDGRLDVLGIADGGTVQAWRNRSNGVGRSMQLALRGKRSAPSGRQAQVEVRRGDFYARYESDGRPLHIALGEGDYAEIVRISWANGFVENKFSVAGGKRWSFEESERVSGSCPSLFAWDGQRFHFVTDAFISGPMGVPMAPGRYFPVDHDEYIRVPGELLRADGGILRLAITEELREAVYLDQARLYAVDHPTAVEVYPNEYLAPGDFPVFKLHATESAAPPPTALDHNGRDVRELISTMDRRYPSDVKRLAYAGLTEPHGVEIGLPPGAAASAHLRLFLSGWFYYFESTSLMAAAQRVDLPIIWPQLQVQVAGRWEKVADIGIPPGKDKTVVVELGGKLPANAERLRIWTNFELYWDRILVDTAAPPAIEDRHFVEAPMRQARLRFRGFSELVRQDGAFPQPERFDYSRVHYGAMWNPLRGKYTRYGDVHTLLAAADSQFAVFGSGDETLLEFDATGLPPLAAGWRRDFVLYLNGYVKDGDRYTAHAGAVDPMPFTGMRQYPFSDADRRAAPFGSAEYRDYLVQFQTRDPLRFTGPRFAHASAPSAPAQE